MAAEIKIELPPELRVILSLTIALEKISKDRAAMSAMTKETRDIVADALVVAFRACGEMGA